LLLADNFNNLIIDVVGGPLNENDKEYLDYLNDKYSEYPNISFLGRKLHSELPELLKKYDININNAKEGFFDKSVLETVSSGLINFYRSSDFDFLYSIKYVQYLKFNDQNLHQKINNLQNLDSEEVLLEIKNSQNYAKEHSLENVTNKLYTIFN
jgi:glycosyltransferase involved in cell wall biosynthesis